MITAPAPIQGLFVVKSGSIAQMMCKTNGNVVALQQSNIPVAFHHEIAEDTLNLTSTSSRYKCCHT